jgi:hypothetical protein
VSDIDVVVVDSLKALDPERPIREADIVVLVAVRSPREYRCIVLTAADAERAAQINLDRGYRTLTRSGEKKKPHKVWIHLQPAPREDKRPSESRKLLKKERQILKHGEGDTAWQILGR